MDNKELKKRLSGVMPLNCGYYGFDSIKQLLEENGGSLTVTFTLEDKWDIKVEGK